MLFVLFLLSCLFGVYTLGEGVSGNTNAGRLPRSKEEEGIMSFLPLDAK